MTKPSLPTSRPERARRSFDGLGAEIVEAGGDAPHLEQPLDARSALGGKPNPQGLVDDQRLRRFGEPLGFDRGHVERRVAADLAQSAAA